MTIRQLPSPRRLWPAIPLLAAVLRVVNLGGRALWYDEAFSVLFARRSVGEMIAGTLGPQAAAAEEHPLLYYFTLHGWMRLFGETPAAVRLLSVLAGVATVAVLYLLGKHLFDRRVAATAALFAAVAPFPLYYAQETRMYALLALCTTAALAFFARAWQDNKGFDWAAYALCGAAALYTHNLAALFLLALGGWILWRWLRGRRVVHWRGVVGAHLGMLALFAPWLWVLPRQLQAIATNYWTQRPGALALVQTLYVFHFAADNEGLPPWLLPFALLFSLLILVLVVMECRHPRHAPAADPFPDAISLLTWLAFGPILLAFLISQVRPIYVLRALLPSAFVYLLLAARLLPWGHAPRAIKGGVLGGALLVVIASLLYHYQYATFPRPPFPQAVAYLRQEVAPGDLIIHSNKLTFLPTYYYDPDLPQTFIADPPGSPSDTLDPATQAALGVRESGDLPTAAQGHPRIWLVIFREAAREGAALHPHLAWLQAHYTLAGTQAFHDLLIYEFR